MKRCLYSLLLCLLSLPAWANPQLVQGGAAVSCPAVSATLSSGVTNSSGQDCTANFTVVSHTSAAAVVQALSTAVVGTGYTLYYYDSTYDGNFAAHFDVVAAQAPAIPSAPTNVTVVAGSGGAANVSWIGSSGATSYGVFRSGVTGNYVNISGPVTGTSYLDTSGTPGTQYYYELVASNSSGNSGASYPVVSYTFPNSAPSGGTGGTPAASGTGLTAALAWSGGSLTITYTGQDSFVQCSWPGGSYTAGDGSTLTTPAAHVLTPTPPVGSSVTFFGRNTVPQVLIVQDNPAAVVPDNATTTVGGDGYVPTPKHNAGDLKIGFGKLGSISIPSGWWTEVIQFASQAAMEAEGMTGPQISVAMQLQTNQVVKDADANATNNQADADKNTGVIQTTLTNFQTSVHDVVTNTEKTVVTDFTSMNTSLFQPDPASLQQFQTSQNKLLDWGPYHFIANFQQVLTQPANDPTGGLSLPVPSVHVDSGLALDSSGKLAYGQAGQWYDTGQKVPIDFSPITKVPLWPFVRGLEGAGVWLAFASALIWYLFPKQTV